MVVEFKPAAPGPLRPPASRVPVKLPPSLWVSRHHGADAHPIRPEYDAAPTYGKWCVGPDETAKPETEYYQHYQNLSEGDCKEGDSRWLNLRPDGYDTRFLSCTVIRAKLDPKKFPDNQTYHAQYKCKLKAEWLKECGTACEIDDYRDISLDRGEVLVMGKPKK
jgi:hypothetical protein